MIRFCCTLNITRAATRGTFVLRRVFKDLSICLKSPKSSEFAIILTNSGQ